MKRKEIRAELNILSINDIIHQKSLRWRHVERMNDNRLLKQVVHYSPRGKSNVGRSRRRWQTLKTKAVQKKIKNFAIVHSKKNYTIILIVLHRN